MSKKEFVLLMGILFVGFPTVGAVIYGMGMLGSELISWLQTIGVWGGLVSAMGMYVEMFVVGGTFSIILAFIVLEITGQ